MHDIALNRTPPATALTRLAPWLEEVRALVKLGAPLVVTQLAQMAMPTTDVVMIGSLGQTSLAAAALATTIYIFLWLAGLGPASAVAPVIAHILGAHPDDRARVRNALRMGLWSVLLMAPLLCLALAFAGPILRALGQSPELAGMAAPYVQILALGIPFSLGFNVLRNFSTALSHPRAPLAVMGVAVLLNGLIDYALLFGHFGMPRLGLVGAAVSTTVCNIFTFAAMAALVSFAPAFRRFRVWRRFHRPDWPRLKEIYRLGFSIGLTMIFEIALFAGATLLMGPFGTAAVAAHQIAMNVPSITFMVPLGLANAATVRVGLAAGAGDRAGVRRAGFAAIALAAFFMALCGIVIASVPRAIVGLYLPVEAPANAAAAALAVTFLYVAAAFQVFDAIQVTASFSLRGLKDAHMPVILAGGSYWLVGFPLALCLGFVIHWQGFGIWLGLAASLAVAAAGMLTRFAHLSGALRLAFGNRGGTV
jgi:MATE family multidrug resistance protein